MAYTHSPETLEKMRLAHLGKVHGVATREKMSAARRGRRGPGCSQAHRLKISLALTGKKSDPETIRKRVASRIGADLDAAQMEIYRLWRRKGFSRDDAVAAAMT